MQIKCSYCSKLFDTRGIFNHIKYKHKDISITSKIQENLTLKNDNIIKLQAIYRGFITRRKRLPNILYYVKRYLDYNNVECSNMNQDGRINSTIDEYNIIDKLINRFNNRVKQPRLRMWYDIKLWDYLYGWIPVNIKTTYAKTADNIGNLAICVHSYTNAILDLNKRYNNGKMASILYSKLQNQEYNTTYKKDYYFIVVNKLDKSIIINSVLGLTHLTPNINNLPYQIIWNKNSIYKYTSIESQLNYFISTIQSSKPSWKEQFLCDIRTIDQRIN